MPARSVCHGRLRRGAPAAAAAVAVAVACAAALAPSPVLVGAVEIISADVSLPGAYHTEACAPTVFVYGDEMILLDKTLTDFKLHHVATGGTDIPLPRAPYDLSPHLKPDEGAGNNVGMALRRGYLEMDVEVPHLSYKVEGDIELTDSFGRVVLRLESPEHHQTRFVTDDDVLMNRLRIELTSETQFLPDYPGTSADPTDVTYMRLTRGGDIGIELVDPITRAELIKWRVYGLRMRTGCKECGRSELSFDHSRYLFPWLPTRYEGERYAVAEQAVHVSRRVVTIEDFAIDMTRAIDPGCNCLYHYGGTLSLELFPRSPVYYLARIELVQEFTAPDFAADPSGNTLVTRERTLFSVPVPPEGGAQAPTLSTWRTLHITVPGSANVWDDPAFNPELRPGGTMSYPYTPDWSNLRLRFRRAGTENPVPMLTVVPSVRHIRYAAADTPSDVFATRVLERPVVWHPHIRIITEDDDFTDTTTHGALDIVPSDPVDALGDAARLDWRDWHEVMSELAAGCVAAGGYPSDPSCADAELSLEVRFLDATPFVPIDPDVEVADDMSTKWPFTLSFTDAAGLEAKFDFSLLSYQAQPEAGWTTVTVSFASAGGGFNPPSPSFNWGDVRTVSILSPLPVLPDGAETPDGFWTWRVETRRFTVQVPQRVGHEWDPLDNHDDLACNFGWGQYSGLRAHYPVRYAHCFECCCFFDDPGSGPEYTRHCYEQGDVIGEVTPSVLGGPNEFCQVCNRAINPQVITPITRMEQQRIAASAGLEVQLPEDLSYPSNATVLCDDWEPCSYNDRCTDEGFCIADVYTTCLIADFQFGNPAKNCEMCDGTGPFSPTRGCTARTDGDHFVYNAGSDDRVCGCFIDGEVWPHGAIDPKRPCMKCDVTESTTQWTPLPNDVLCDITEQIDWQFTPAQACSEVHTCLDGICGGNRYACPPLQECEAVSPDVPRLCDLSGLASETGGCQRDTLPDDEQCGEPINGCTPQPMCTGILGTCPPLQYRPGIIYDDNSKNIELVLPDGLPAHADLPAIPNTDSVAMILRDYRVQCDNLWVQNSVILDGQCLYQAVNPAIAGWGSSNFVPARGVFGVAAAQWDLALRAPPPPPAEDDGVYPGSSLVRVVPGGGDGDGSPDMPVDIADLTHLLVPTCDCLVDTLIDVDVYLHRNSAYMESGRAINVTGGYLQDASGTRLEFAFDPLMVSKQVIGGWFTATAPVLQDDQRGFDFAAVESWALVTGDEGHGEGGAYATARDLRIRADMGAGCLSVEVVPEAAPLPLQWEAPEELEAAAGLAGEDTESRVSPTRATDVWASARLPSTVDASPLWTRRSASFDDVILTAQVRVRGRARVTALQLLSTGPGVEDPVAGTPGVGFNVLLPHLPDVGDSDWAQFSVSLRPAMWPLNNTFDSWTALDTVRVSVNASTAYAVDRATPAGADAIAVRDLYITKRQRVSTTAYCYSPMHERASGDATMFREAGASWAGRDVTGELAAGDGSSQSAGLDTLLSDAIVLQGEFLDLYFRYGILSQRAVDLHVVDLTGLAPLWDASGCGGAGCFQDAYLELVASFENPRMLIDKVWVLDQEDDGLVVPLALNSASLNIGLGVRNTIRVDLKASHVVGPPFEWLDANVLQFSRTTEGVESQRDVGRVVVHSLAVRSYGVPCLDGDSVPGALRLFDDAVALSAVEGSVALQPRELHVAAGAGAVPARAAAGGPYEAWPSALAGGVAVDASASETFAAETDYATAAVAGRAGVVVAGGSVSAHATVGGEALREDQCYALRGCAVLAAKDAAGGGDSLAPVWQRVVTSLTANEKVTDRVSGVAATGDGRSVLAAGWVHTDVEGGFVSVRRVDGTVAATTDGVGMLGGGSPVGLGGQDGFLLSADAATGDVHWLAQVSTYHDDRLFDVGVAGGVAIAVGDTRGLSGAGAISGDADQLAAVAGSRFAALAVAVSVDDGSELWRAVWGHPTERPVATLTSVSMHGSSSVAVLSGEARKGRMSVFVDATGGTVTLGDVAQTVGSDDMYAFAIGVAVATGEVQWAVELTAAATDGAWFALAPAGMSGSDETVYLCGALTLDEAATDGAVAAASAGAALPAVTLVHASDDGDDDDHVWTSTTGASDAVLLALERGTGALVWASGWGGGTTLSGDAAASACTGTSWAGASLYVTGTVSGGASIDVDSDGALGDAEVFALDYAESDVPLGTTAGLVLEVEAVTGVALTVDVVRSDARAEADVQGGGTTFDVSGTLQPARLGYAAVRGVAATAGGITGTDSRTRAYVVGGYQGNLTLGTPAVAAFPTNTHDNATAAFVAAISSMARAASGELESTRGVGHVGRLADTGRTGTFASARYDGHVAADASANAVVTVVGVAAGSTCTATVGHVTSNSGSGAQKAYPMEPGASVTGVDHADSVNHAVTSHADSAHTVSYVGVGDASTGHTLAVVPVDSGSATESTVVTGVAATLGGTAFAVAGYATVDSPGTGFTVLGSDVPIDNADSQERMLFLVRVSPSGPRAHASNHWHQRHFANATVTLGWSLAQHTGPGDPEDTVSGDTGDAGGDDSLTAVTASATHVAAVGETTSNEVVLASLGAAGVTVSSGSVAGTIMVCDASTGELLRFGQVGGFAGVEVKMRAVALSTDDGDGMEVYVGGVWRGRDMYTGNLMHVTYAGATKVPYAGGGEAGSQDEWVSFVASYRVATGRLNWIVAVGTDDTGTSLGVDIAALLVHSSGAILAAGNTDADAIFVRSPAVDEAVSPRVEADTSGRGTTAWIASLEPWGGEADWVQTFGGDAGNDGDATAVVGLESGGSDVAVAAFNTNGAFTELGGAQSRWVPGDDEDPSRTRAVLWSFVPVTGTGVQATGLGTEIGSVVTSGAAGGEGFAGSGSYNNDQVAGDDDAIAAFAAGPAPGGSVVAVLQTRGSLLTRDFDAAGGASPDTSPARPLSVLPPAHATQASPDIVVVTHALDLKPSVRADVPGSHQDGVASTTRGEFVRTFEGTGTAEGLGTSIGALSVFSVGRFRGTIASGPDEGDVYESVGGPEYVADPSDGAVAGTAFDGFVSAYSRSTGELVDTWTLAAADPLSDASAHTRDDSLSATATARNGLRHFVVGHFNHGDTPGESFSFAETLVTTAGGRDNIVAALDDELAGAWWASAAGSTAGSDRLNAVGAGDGFAIVGGSTTGDPSFAGVASVYRGDGAGGTDVEGRTLATLFTLTDDGGELFGTAFGTDDAAPGGSAAVTSIAVDRDSRLVAVGGIFVGGDLVIPAYDVEDLNDGVVRLAHPGASPTAAIAGFVALFRLVPDAPPVGVAPVGPVGLQCLWAVAPSHGGAAGFSAVRGVDIAAALSSGTASGASVLVTGEFSTPTLTFAGPPSASVSKTTVEDSSTSTYTGYIARIAGADGAGLWATAVDSDRSSGCHDVALDATERSAVAVCSFSGVGVLRDAGAASDADAPPRAFVDANAPQQLRTAVATLSVSAGVVTHWEALGGAQAGPVVPMAVGVSHDRRAYAVSGARFGDVRFRASAQQHPWLVSPSAGSPALPHGSDGTAVDSWAYDAVRATVGAYGGREYTGAPQESVHDTHAFVALYDAQRPSHASRLDTRAARGDDGVGALTRVAPLVHAPGAGMGYDTADLHDMSRVVAAASATATLLGMTTTAGAAVPLPHEYAGEGRAPPSAESGGSQGAVFALHTDSGAAMWGVRPTTSAAGDTVGAIASSGTGATYAGDATGRNALVCVAAYTGDASVADSTGEHVELFGGVAGAAPHDASGGQVTSIDAAGALPGNGDVVVGCFTDVRADATPASALRWARVTASSAAGTERVNAMTVSRRSGSGKGHAIWIGGSTTGRPVMAGTAVTNPGSTRVSNSRCMLALLDSHYGDEKHMRLFGSSAEGDACAVTAMAPLDPHVPSATAGRVLLVAGVYSGAGKMHFTQAGVAQGPTMLLQAASTYGLSETSFVVQYSHATDNGNDLGFTGPLVVSATGPVLGAGGGLAATFARITSMSLSPVDVDASSAEAVMPPSTTQFVLAVGGEFAAQGISFAGATRVAPDVDDDAHSSAVTCFAAGGLVSINSRATGGDIASTAAEVPALTWLTRRPLGSTPKVYSGRAWVSAFADARHPQAAGPATPPQCGAVLASHDAVRLVGGFAGGVRASSGHSAVPVVQPAVPRVTHVEPYTAVVLELDPVSGSVIGAEPLGHGDSSAVAVALVDDDARGDGARSGVYAFGAFHGDVLAAPAAGPAVSPLVARLRGTPGIGIDTDEADRRLSTVFRAHLARAPAQAAPAGPAHARIAPTALPSTADASRLVNADGAGTFPTDAGEACGCVAGFQLEMDVWLADTSYPIVGGTWYAHEGVPDSNGAGAKGFSFAFDADVQRAASPRTWFGVKASIDAADNFGFDLSGDGTVSAAQLAAMGAFVLHRDGGTSLPATHRAALKDGWRVRNARLLPAPGAGGLATTCAKCGRVRVTSRRVTVAVDGVVPAFEDAAWGYLESTDADVNAGEATAAARANVLTYPVDLTSVVDVACNCLDGVVATARVCGVDDGASPPLAGLQLPDARAPDELVMGIALTSLDGGTGAMTFTLDSVASQADTDPVTGADVTCFEYRFALAAGDHVKAASMVWGRTGAARLLADVDVAGLMAGAGVPTVRVSGIVLDRACPPETRTQHPQPLTGDSEMKMARDGLSLVHGLYYRIITKEFNVWGDVGVPSCSDSFVVDTTPPDVSGNDDKVYDFSVEIGADESDIQYTRFFNLSVGWSDVTFLEPESAPTNLLMYSVGKVTQDSADGAEVPGVDPRYSVKELPRVGDGFVVSNFLPALTDGVQYFVHLFVWNPARLSSVVVTDGVTHDSSAPVPAGTLREVASGDPGDADADVDHQLSTTTLYAAFDGFTDPHTFVWELRVGLGDTPLGPSVIPYEVIANDATAHTFTAPGDGFDIGQQYFAVFLVTNPAGAAEVYASDGVYVDNTAPFPLWANDIWFLDPTGIDTLADEDADTGDIEYHNGHDIVRGKWKCDDDESVRLGERGTMTYRWRVCDTTECDATVYHDWMDVGAAQTGDTPSGLPGLSDGSDIYIQVECTNPVGLSHTFSTNGMTVAVGTPDVSGATSYDLDPDVEGGLLTDDVDAHNAATLRVSWQGIVKHATGPDVSYYEVAVGTSAEGEADDLLSWVYNGLSTDFETDAARLNLTDGDTYYATVRAVSLSGDTASITTDGVLSDQSPPVGGVVEDTRFSEPPEYCPNLVCVAVGDASDDVDAIPNSVSLAAVVSNVTEPHSAVNTYAWAVSTCDAPLDFNTVPLTSPAPDQTTFSADELGLFHGIQYCVVVEVTNTAGAVGHFVSDGFRVDLTPPQVTYVNEGDATGVAEDEDFIGVLDTVATSFACHDFESEIVDYAVWLIELDPATGNEIGAASGVEDVGVDITFEFTSLSLENGHVYATAVECTNSAGVQTVGVSDGFLVDTTPPDVSGMDVWHGTHGLVVDYQPLNHAITASWSGQIDPESGVASFAWSVGSSEGGSDVVGITATGAATFASAAGLDLADGETVYVTVYVYNTPGLMSTYSSTGVTIDTSPPQSGEVVVTEAGSEDPGDGLGPVAFIASRGYVHATWGALVDAHSPVNYEWAIGVTRHGQQALVYTDVGSATEASTLLNVSLAAGAYYYVSVRAVNYAGLATHVASARVYVDPYAPEPGTVNVYEDATGENAQVPMSTVTNEVNCAWRGFWDELSGLETYEIGLGTSVNVDNTVSFVEVAADQFADEEPLTHTFGGLSLVTGVRYYCVVRATDKAANFAVVSSEGIMIDATPPPFGVINDGFEANGDADFQYNATSLRGWWRGWNDLQSGVVGQRWAIGTSAGDDDVMAWTELPYYVQSGIYTPAKQAPPADPLEIGTPYYVSIVVTNALGLESTASSDGMTLLAFGSAVTDGFEFAPDVQIVGMLSAEPSIAGAAEGAPASWCDCVGDALVASGAVWDEVTGSCSCGAGTYLDVHTGLCVSCPDAAPCKATPGNSRALCVEPEGGLGNPCDADEPLVTPVDTGALAQDDCTLTAGTYDLGNDLPRTAANDTDGDGCGCGPGTFLDILTDGGASCAPCGPRHAGHYKTSVSDALSQCRQCWRPTLLDTVLQVDWTTPAVEASSASSEMRVYAGLASGDRRWRATLASDATSVQFTARTHGTETEDDAPPIPVQHGAVYFVTLELVEMSLAEASGDVADEVILAWARTVTEPLDLTPPEAGAIVDGPAVSDSCAEASSTLSASWHSFADPESGIDHYEVAFGTTGEGSADLTGGVFVDVGNATSFEVVESGAVSGDVVTTTVRAFNAAPFGGAATQLASNGFVVHLSVPEGLVIVRGDVPAGALDASPFPHLHSPTQQSTTRVFVGWLFGDGAAVADPCVGLIVSYTWWIETADGDGDPSGDVVRAAEDVKGVTEVEVDNLDPPLVPGGRYVVMVTATTALGITSTAASAPVLVDDSEPYDGTVALSPTPDAEEAELGPTGQVYQSSTTTVQASWSFTEPDTDIVAVSVAVGSVPGGEQSLAVRTYEVADDASVDVLGGAATLDALETPMQHGGCYFVHVAAVNAARQASTFAVSAPLCVDTSSPQVDVDVAWTDAGLGADDVDPGSALHADHRAAAGAASSDARAALLVGDGVLYQNGANGDSLDIRLLLTALDRESGLSSVLTWLSLSDDPADDGAALTPPTPLPTEDLSATGDAAVTVGGTDYSDDETLPRGTPIFAILATFNRAGLAAAAAAVPFVIDDTAPEVEVTVNALQSSLTTVSALWTASDDESALLSMSWAITRASDGAVVMSTTDAGLAGGATATGLELAHATSYDVTVSACNVVGLCAESVAASFTTDVTPPTVGTMVLTPDADAGSIDIEAAYCAAVPGAGDGGAAVLACAAPTAPFVVPTTVRNFTVEWGGFDDPVSSVVSYRVSVGTSLLGTQLLAPIDVDGDVTAIHLGDELAAALSEPEIDAAFAELTATGGALYVSVTAFNDVGLHSTLADYVGVYDALAPLPSPVGFGGPATEAHSVALGIDAEGAVLPDEAAAGAGAGTAGNVVGSAAVVPPFSQQAGSDITLTWDAFTDNSGNVTGYTAELRKLAGRGTWFAPVPSGSEPLSSAHGDEATVVVVGPVRVDPAMYDEASLQHTFTAAEVEESGVGGVFVGCVTASDAVGNELTLCTPRPLVVDATPPVLSVLNAGGGEGAVASGGVGAAHVSEGFEGDLERDCMPRTGTSAGAGVVVIAGPGVATSGVTTGSDPAFVNPFQHTVVPAWWPAFVDGESGVAAVEAALGTVPGADDVVPFTQVPGRQNAAQFVLPVQREGRVLYASARAVNSAGLASEVVSSDGVRVLCTPGSPGCDYDGFFLCQPSGGGGGGFVAGSTHSSIE